MGQTIWAETALLPGGWAEGVRVVLEAGRIASVAPAPAEPADLRVGALLPAPVNLHSHTFQRAMAGLTEARGPEPRDTFWTWRALMFRFLDRLAPEDVEAIAAMAMVEMLEAGFAAVAEFHYLHHAPGGRPYAARAEMAGRIAAAAAATGCGLTLLPVLYEVGGCDGCPLGPGQVRFGCDPEGFARLVEEARGLLRGLPADTGFGIAPHSLRAVTPAGLAAALELAGDGPVHMHLAEQVAEVEEVRAARGAAPAAWLMDHAPVGPAWCLIHCTQVAGAELARLAQTGAVAGLCPVTEANLGDGIFAATDWRAAGGRWGVGTDSNIRIGLAEELRGLDQSQRLRDRVRAALAEPDRSTGRVLVEEAAAGGAQAGGRAAGRIAPGLWADLAAHDRSALDLVGRRGDRIADAIVFAGGAAGLRDVWSAGRHVVRGGRHVAREGVEAAYRATLARLGDLL